jgi:hypothetical protein
MSSVVEDNDPSTRDRIRNVDQTGLHHCPRLIVMIISPICMRTLGPRWLVMLHTSYQDGPGYRLSERPAPGLPIQRQFSLALVLHISLTGGSPNRPKVKKIFFGILSLLFYTRRSRLPFGTLRCDLSASL